MFYIFKMFFKLFRFCINASLFSSFYFFLYSHMTSVNISSGYFHLIANVIQISISYILNTLLKLI
nr:MAG TPA: hypothetical protein [Crassvirales sp.]